MKITNAALHLTNPYTPAIYYSYDNTLLRVIEGKDARSIYWTIIENKLVTLLSHAAYHGKELEKAELSYKLGIKYVQDGA